MGRHGSDSPQGAPPLGRLLFAVIAPARRFFQTEAAGGIVLIVCAAIALALASSPLADAYAHLLHTPIRLGFGARELAVSVHAVINDGLMTIFFVVAGMEIKRELVSGELRTPRRAALPLVAAAGGMVAPALAYLALNPALPGRAGWGIPTATDIAFALGCLSLVRRRVPWSLFVFLTALAIFDDLGAILVIALFYGGEVSLPAVAVAALPALALALLNRARVVALWPYLVVGALLWAAVARSGLHPTLAGVVLGVAIPTVGRRAVGDVLTELDGALDALKRLPAAEAEAALTSMERHLESVHAPAARLLHGLHGPVAFGIVPLFALANAGVRLDGDAALLSPVALGVALGLVCGKAAGVFGATFVAVRLGLAPRPSGSTWRQVFGVALMAGVGFTMSLFVTGLAFGGDPALETPAKVGILAGSAVSALLALGILVAGKRAPESEGEAEPARA